MLFLDEPTSGLEPVAARDVHELIGELRRRGVTIFLTTHRLEEAERLCDRVAILNTMLRTIGRPDELRDRLFARTLTVRTVAPLPEPGRIFARLPAVDSWRIDGAGCYVLAVSDPADAAPPLTRALVAADADVLSISESHHSLEDVAPTSAVRRRILPLRGPITAHHLRAPLRRASRASGAPIVRRQRTARWRGLRRPFE